MITMCIECKRRRQPALFPAFHPTRDNRNICSSTDRREPRKTYNLRSLGKEHVHLWVELICYPPLLVCHLRPLVASVSTEAECNNRWTKLGLQHLILGLIMPLTFWINQRRKIFLAKSSLSTMQEVRRICKTS